MFSLVNKIGEAGNILLILSLVISVFQGSLKEALTNSNTRSWSKQFLDLLQDQGSVVLQITQKERRMIEVGYGSYIV